MPRGQFVSPRLLLLLCAAFSKLWANIRSPEPRSSLASARVSELETQRPPTVRHPCGPFASAAPDCNTNRLTEFKGEHRSAPWAKTFSPSFQAMGPTRRKSGKRSATLQPGSDISNALKLAEPPLSSASLVSARGRHHPPGCPEPGTSPLIRPGGRLGAGRTFRDGQLPLIE